MKSNRQRTPEVKPKVLVVDSDVNSLLTLICLLNRNGIPARGASGARTALGLLADGMHSFTVVIASTGVPAVDGTLFLHHCRAEFQEIPIIAMAESPGTQFADKGGFFAYLDRPIQREQLFNLVTLALEHSAARRRETTVFAGDWMPAHDLGQPEVDNSWRPVFRTTEVPVTIAAAASANNHHQASGREHKLEPALS